MVADPLHENWYWTTKSINEKVRAGHFHIYPGHRPGDRWSFDELLVFLNELDDHWQIHDCPRAYQGKKHEWAYTRFTIKRLIEAGEEDPGDIWVLIPVPDG
jgi:hypothetical protein